ncbi:MAG: response regulator [Hyphomicrobiales bacterium]|nr:response regulator [Hyphomicrobiales bacterium]
MDTKPALSDNAAHILIVDDDQRIRDLLARYLTDNGYRVSTAADAGAARANLRGLSYDLIILDVMMPGESGLSLAQSLRADSPVPILMLTARSEPENRLKGLEIGVDDYMPKPFEPKELLIRLNNILKRRTPQADAEEVRIGPFVLNVKRGELKRGDETIKLTERERDLLRQFAMNPGVAISREELSGGGEAESDRAVDVQINRLRQKIETDPSNPVYLQTVRGRGYVLYTE